MDGRDPPVVLVKWYDFTRWLLERVDSFPKNQRFIFGTRLADHALAALHDELVPGDYLPGAYHYFFIYEVWRQIEFCPNSHGATGRNVVADKQMRVRPT